MSSEVSLTSQDKLKLESWGIPDYILQRYIDRGIHSMFPWQVECLTSGNVLDGGNLVYSAPTSAGKTLVAEILTLQTVLERKKKVVIILPFVSLVREKMLYFQDILTGSGVRVEGFMGSYSPPGGFKAVHVAICTIEKANSLLNRLLEERNFGDIGCVVVDELHLLGDPHRGYLLELLLTKIKYICQKGACDKIQIIGMSATLPNLDLLASWLNATLYKTDFRPIPLYEYLKVNKKIFKTPNLELHEEIIPSFTINKDPGDVIYLCIDTILKGYSVIVFCPTKNWCESLAQQVSMEIRKLGSSKDETGALLRQQLNSDGISDILEQLKKSSAGLDPSLGKSISFGVGFHHAGLTLDERDIVEGAFRKCILRVIVATSTLSSGVNLPARRVIIRSPSTFGGRKMDVLSYKQMIGRAGRMGKDSAGESFLICTEEDKFLGQELVNAKLPAVESCLGHGNLSSSLKRAILEIVASGIVTNKKEVRDYASCTLLAQCVGLERLEEVITACLLYLQVQGFVTIREMEENQQEILPSNLAEACLSASMPPDQGLILANELGRARRCFVLETDLHAIYQVTPYTICDHWDIDWVKVFTLWESLPERIQNIGLLIGVEDRFLLKAMRSAINFKDHADKVAVHKRFFTALALQDLINETPLKEVANKFGCNKGILQSLQQSASTFSGMVTNFCRKLKWGALEVVVAELGRRIQFGVQRDLLDLMRLDCMISILARGLFSSGITTLSELARSNIYTVQTAIRKAVAFQSEADGVEKRSKRDICLPGRTSLTDLEAAEIFIHEARVFILKEMGVKSVDWNDSGLNRSIYECSTLDPLAHEIAKSTPKGPENRSCLVINNSGAKPKIGALVRSINVSETEELAKAAPITSDHKSSVIFENNLKSKNSACVITSNDSHSEMIDVMPSTDCNDISDIKNFKRINFADLLNISSPIAKRIGESSESIIVPASQDLDSSSLCKSVPKVTDVDIVPRKVLKTNKFTDENELQFTNFSSAFEDSFDLKKTNQPSPILLHGKPKSSTPIASPDVIKRKLSIQTKLSCSGAESPDMFGESLKETDCEQKDDDVFQQTAPDIDPNWGGDSLMEISMSNVEHLVNESRKRKLSNISQSSPTIFKKPCTALLLCEINKPKTNQVEMDNFFGESFDLNTQLDKVIDNHIATNQKMNKNSISDSFLAGAFEDTFDKQEKEKIKETKVTEILASPFDTQEKEKNPVEANELKIIENSPTQQNVSHEIIDDSSDTSFELTNVRRFGTPSKKKQMTNNKDSDLEFKANIMTPTKKVNSPRHKKLISPSKYPNVGITLVKQLKYNKAMDSISSEKDMFSSTIDQSYIPSFESKTPSKIPTLETKNYKNKVPDQIKETFEGKSVCGDQTTNCSTIFVCKDQNSLDQFFNSFLQIKSSAFYIEVVNVEENNKTKIGSKFKTKKCAANPELKYKDKAISKIYFTWGNNIFVCDVEKADCRCIPVLKMILQMKETELWSFNIKEQIKFFYNCSGILIKNKIKDVAIADWLLNPQDSNKTISDVAKEHLPSQFISQVTLQQSGKALDVKLIWGLQSELANKLQHLDLLNIFNEIEMPTALCLAYVELTGISLNRDFSTALWNSVENRMKNLERELFRLSGYHFNINSSKDIKKVKLQLKISSETEPDHPVFKNIHYWRKLSSLKSRNLSQLLGSVDADGRCRGFSKMFTCTGRIVMSDPNLQHIPRDFSVDGELFSPRSSFLCKPGNLFLSADFSQLELRILAHFSQDPVLISLINSEKDIFVSISANWKGISCDQVTDEIRQQTKQIIYGLIYGMGDKTLGDTLGVSTAEAGIMGANFKRSYPGVQEFLKSCIADCERKGYITTITGRKRILTGINSNNKAIRGQAERQAINSVIQGSAADIAKRAMVRIEDRLNEILPRRTPLLSNGCDSHLVLHLHDELLYEVSIENLDIVKRVVKWGMETSMELSVRLPVVLKIGSSWGQLKKIS